MRLLGIAAALTLSLGLGACAGTPFDPAALLSNPTAIETLTSGLSGTAKDIADGTLKATDTVIGGLAVAADKYCNPLTATGRKVLRDLVNAKLAATGSTHRLNDFCAEAPTAAPGS
jgi:hypothetical protein